MVLSGPVSALGATGSATTAGGNPVIDLTGGGSMASITKAGSIRIYSSTKLHSSNSVTSTSSDLLLTKKK